MKKALIPALSLLLLAPLAQATNMNLNLDEKCEMTLPHDMRLDKSGFTVADKDKTLMRYQDGTLVIGVKPSPSVPSSARLWTALIATFAPAPKAPLAWG